MNYAAEVNSLEKSYGSHKVLNGVTFQVAKGEIFALLGVNGAGKTTALECMEGLRRYDGGSITVNGKMGIQLQSSSLPSHIRAMEAVKLFSKWNKTAIDHEMLAALGISELAARQYIDLSTGQKRRLHLALALSGKPDILFLDEPTAGLDVEGRISLHEQIRKLKAQGITIILASHDMAEVENLCDRICVINGGKIVFNGTVEEMTEKIGSRYTLQIKTADGDETFEAENISDALLAQLEDYRQRGVKVLDIKIDRGSLEQHFIEIARRNGR